MGSAGPAQLFNVVNEGTAPLDVGTTGFSGLDPDQFRISTDTCVETTLTIGERCSVGIRFAPDSAGAKTAMLRVRTGAGTQTASLSGEGVAGTSSD